VGSVDIDGSLLQKGPVKTPLTTALTILEAKQLNSPLPLLQEGPYHSAILNGPGPFAVSLGVAAPLAIEAGRASFTLPVPLASSSNLSLELPGNHANVRIEPGLVTSRQTSNGNTLIEAALEPGKPARIWWTTREIAAPGLRNARFVSFGHQAGRLCRRFATPTHRALRRQRHQGEATEFKMTLPPVSN
jgi:hypothetical protein